ncbi:ABC transporter ATP-binding protein [Actinosynnema sp. NPDC047251]|uniref:ABC-type transporter, ATPase subunit n=1 Tax=Saccharothrix espanaensis (strain ATCC 51144 / DSM 44229 / JCM 9112 / NBRC 15066 / NRRL 15764) TaxID=1179773 RepID=K0K5J8_SACES|nr:ABC transporter ATP-binding protein [Saccharothrix espanaensis]CCH32877.1 ABC-type transporter, ATPase subunit [Saccharothrix espanaensis DSM 44229]
MECRCLRKNFGDLAAVDDVSFHLSEGETYGLLGPNGAGKSTTISMVAGILAPDSGKVLVYGVSAGSAAAKRRIGYVPQELALYPDLTGRENLRFFARLYGLSGRASARRIDHVLEVVGLGDRAGDLAREYSGGMKRRLNVGARLLHQPLLLVLDEPRAGVDPQSRNAIVDNVRELAAAGMAILYTTHYMEEAERLCDPGRRDRRGTSDSRRTRRELVERLGERSHISLVVQGDTASALAAARALPAVRSVPARGDEVELVVTDAGICLPEVLAAVTRDGVSVRSVQVTEPDLKTVFLHLTGKALKR